MWNSPPVPCFTLLGQISHSYYLLYLWEYEKYQYKLGMSGKLPGNLITSMISQYFFTLSSQPMNGATQVIISLHFEIWKTSRITSSWNLKILHFKSGGTSSLGGAACIKKPPSILQGLTRHKWVSVPSNLQQTVTTARVPLYIVRTAPAIGWNLGRNWWKRNLISYNKKEPTKRPLW